MTSNDWLVVVGIFTFGVVAWQAWETRKSAQAAAASAAAAQATAATQKVLHRQWLGVEGWSESIGAADGQYDLIVRHAIANRTQLPVVLRRVTYYTGSKPGEWRWTSTYRSTATIPPGNSHYPMAFSVPLDHPGSGEFFGAPVRVVAKLDFESAFGEAETQWFGRFYDVLPSFDAVGRPMEAERDCREVFEQAVEVGGAPPESE